jgi:crossover junction endodeoxyribonuclease RusA
VSKSDLEDALAFQIGYPDRKLSPNARGKWALKETARKLAKVEGYTSARNAMKNQALESSDAYAVDIIFHPPDRRHRDVDNAFSSIKNHLDGACQALGINDKLFKKFTLQFGEPVNNGCVNVCIKPIVKSGKAVKEIQEYLEAE